MDVASLVFAAVAAFGALAALRYARRTIDVAQAAAQEASRDNATARTEWRELNAAAEAARRDELLLELKLQQARQLDRIAGILDEIRRAAIDETAAPGSDLDAPSPISSLGQRLTTAVDVFALMGGPSLPNTRTFASKASIWKRGKPFLAYADATIIAAEINAALGPIKLHEVLQRIAARPVVSPEPKRADLHVTGAPRSTPAGG